MSSSLSENGEPPELKLRFKLTHLTSTYQSDSLDGFVLSMLESRYPCTSSVKATEFTGVAHPLKTVSYQS